MPADDASAAAEVSHPTFIAPVNPATGADDLEPRLSAEETYRWSSASCRPAQRST
jgi:hypothetical protein